MLSISPLAYSSKLASSQYKRKPAEHRVHFSGERGHPPYIPRSGKKGAIQTFIQNCEDPKFVGKRFVGIICLLIVASPYLKHTLSNSEETQYKRGETTVDTRDACSAVKKPPGYKPNGIIRTVPAGEGTFWCEFPMK